MPNYADPNVVDLTNSTSTPLPASGVFVGVFHEVTGVTSVSVLVHSDRASATNGLLLQWSTDGVNVDDEQGFNYAGTASGLGLVVHASVRAAFVRVRYTNSASAQTFLRLQTMLRREAPQGSIGYIGQPVTTNDDTVVTKAVLAARQVDSPSNIVLPFCSGDPFLITTPPPNTSVLQNETTVTAQTAFSQALDLFGIFGPTRHHFHVYNDTVRGNLFLRFGSSGASLSAFNVKVPPRHAWELPRTWRRWPGQINGIWDVADGSARCTEWF